jgi:hypothetical protein
MIILRDEHSLIVFTGQGPTVIVDLDGPIGVVNGRLKFGQSKFSERSRNSRIEYKNGVNYLVAECMNDQGTFVRSELKLDGTLLITIPDAPRIVGRANDEGCTCCCGGEN